MIILATFTAKSENKNDGKLININLQSLVN